MFFVQPVAAASDVLWCDPEFRSCNVFWISSVSED